MDLANGLAIFISTLALWLSWKAHQLVTKPLVFAEFPIQDDDSGQAIVTLQNRGSQPAYEVNVSFSVGYSTYLRYVPEGGDEALPELMMPDLLPVEVLQGGQSYPVAIRYWAECAEKVELTATWKAGRLRRPAKKKYPLVIFVR